MLALGIIVAFSKTTVLKAFATNLGLASWCVVAAASSSL
jgi:hypothetical protein